MDVTIKSVSQVREMSLAAFKDILKEVLDDQNPPEISLFKDILRVVLEAFAIEDTRVRPADKDGKPGGLVDLTSSSKVVILPDLHARRFFLKSVLFWKVDGTDFLIDLLQSGEYTLLCLGDGVHSEGEFAARWVKAFSEFKRGYKKSVHMDAEIGDSFNLMLAVMLLKVRFDGNFHFLKGNHENITNETGNGNYSFAKFANEGVMVIEYFKKFYDDELIKLYYDFEKKLPLFVQGRTFLASHAEPYYFFEKERILNYSEDDDLIEALTWTDNHSAEEGALDQLLDYYIPGNDDTTCYFGGHRPIMSLYNRIYDNRYVQIHNPLKQIAAVIDQNISINLDDQIVIVPDYSDLESAEDDTTVIDDEPPLPDDEDDGGSGSVFVKMQ